MRTAYKVLAYLVAVEVVIQAMAMVWAVAGLGKWIDRRRRARQGHDGERRQPFPEITGLIVHGINGSFVIPGSR